VGFHVCTYCSGAPHPATSSGDVMLRFAAGRHWQMPDMILHYVEAHRFLPEADFVHDVMHGTLAPGSFRDQAKAPARQIGYLEGEFPQGDPPTGFVDRLRVFMKEAREKGDRRQTRGL
jgi:hypothetical protein